MGSCIVSEAMREHGKTFVLSMTPLFTRDRFGSPQVIAALLLLVFLLQCVWLASRQLRVQQSTSFGEAERIHAGLRQLKGQGVAGTPETTHAGDAGASFNEGFDGYRSPLWYLIAAAPFAVLPQSDISPAGMGWLSRLPYLCFGVLLGASLWYVARRLFGNAGGYIALTLYCFAPGTILSASGGVIMEPEIGTAWGTFGAIFTAIAVAHTLYAPREVVLWNWRRIILLALSLVLAIGSQFSLLILLPLTLAFMYWVAPTRRSAATVIWVSALLVSGLLLLASYAFHPLLMWKGFLHARLMPSFQALATPGVYRQLGSFLAKSSPALVIALPVAFITYAAWSRARYFGNTAPLLVALLLLVLGLATPHAPGAALYVSALAFLFTFVAGVLADLLETRHRTLIGAGTFGLLAASALWNLMQLASL
ncbi:MAG TPA: hypothetical protein VHR84_17785 [Terriglobales bacterium]|jgi:hypothetical protein|nr:hypothetical protein [Terriglobales bacterium]